MPEPRRNEEDAAGAPSPSAPAAAPAAAPRSGPARFARFVDWFTGTNGEVPAEDPRRSWEPILLALFLAVSLGWAVQHARVGWRAPISDAHGFRQAQTAITSVYLARGGPFLRYETPVVGAPWAIPYELPLYQWIVAKAGGPSVMGAITAGRGVDEAFFALSLVVLFLVLGELGVVPMHRCAVLALALLSPTYLFWSRSVMMESTALFFSLVALWLLARAVRAASLAPLAIAGAAVAGAIAMMVKGTTYPAFAFAGIALVAADAWRHRTEPLRARAVRFVVFGAAIAALPLVAGLAWTAWADGVKAMNPIGTRLTTAASRAWNYGTLAQRVEGHTWSTVWSRMFPEISGASWVPLLALAGLAVSRRRLLEAAAALGGFASVLLLFTNLHVIHNYYQYANGLFLIGAIGFVVIGLLEAGGWKRVAGLVLVAAVGLAQAATYVKTMLPMQGAVRNRTLQVATLLAKVTRPDEVIAVLGFDWTSEVPFYADRRGLMVPDWLGVDPASKIFTDERAALAADHRHVGALLACGAAVRDLAGPAKLAASFDLSPEPLNAGGCGLFVSAERRAEILARTGTPAAPSATPPPPPMR